LLPLVEIGGIGDARGVPRNLILGLAVAAGHAAFATPRTAEAAPPVLAVFAVEDTRVGKNRFSDQELASLTEYLAAKLSHSGAFQVVPDAQLKAALGERKASSLRACYDQACQIEVGKEVAAEKSLSTKIVMIGSTCDVSSTVYDLKRAASEGGADEEGSCKIDTIREGLKRIAERVSRGVAPAARDRSEPPPPAPAPAPAPAKPACARFAGVWVRPQDNLVFVFTEGADCEMTVTLPGTGFVHTLRATAQGNELHGWMTRQNRQNGCTVQMDVRFTLIGPNQIDERVEGVQGRCDIGSEYRERFLLSRQP
jgi:hypothetical protein